MKRYFHFMPKENSEDFRWNKRPFTILIVMGIVTVVLFSMIGCGPSRRQYAINEALLIDQTRLLEDEIFRTRVELEKILRENEQLRSELTENDNKGTSQSRDNGSKENSGHVQKVLPISYPSENPGTETLPQQVVKPRPRTHNPQQNSLSKIIKAPEQKKAVNTAQTGQPQQTTQQGQPQQSQPKLPGQVPLSLPPSDAARQEIRQPNLVQPANQTGTQGVSNPVWQQNNASPAGRVSPTGYDTIPVEEYSDELSWSPLENL